MGEKREFFREQTERIEELVRKLNGARDPELHAAALELVQSVLELHGAALQRMLEIVEQNEAGEQLRKEFLRDDLVSSLMLLHELHPEDLETRVHRGLEKVRPYLRLHGGDVELTSLENGVAKVRLQGSCGSCSASSLTLKNAVEDALYEAAPDLQQIVAEQASEAAQASGLVVLK